ncbi:hypothetical protein [Streptomyces sp. NPDC058683]
MSSHVMPASRRFSLLARSITATMAISHGGQPVAAIHVRTESAA